MKFLKLLFLVFTLQLNAQNTEGYGFAIINDKDGYTNVRAEPNTQSKIVGKLKEGELFYCFSDGNDKDWFSVDFKGNSGSWGYVHKSRIKFVETLPKLTKRKVIKDTLYIKNDSISLKLVVGDFVVSKHKITKNNNFVAKIDGKKPWGVDGGLPKKELRSIHLTIGEEAVNISKSEWNDLYEPNLGNAEVYVAPNGNIYFSMSNSDGAGGYVAAFSFKDRRFQQRYVFYGF